MNGNVKAKWLERLRDPEAKQIKKALKTDAGNCCLGVLCEIAVAEEIITMQDPAGFNDASSYRFGEAGNIGVLPSAVVAWAGLDSVNPYVTDSNDDATVRSRPLTEFNDNGKTFIEIADMIDKSL